MSHDPVSMSPAPGRRRFREPLILALAGVISLGAAGAASAATSKPTAAKGFTLSKIADAPKGVHNCDDLAFLDGHLFVACQNNLLSNGSGGPPTPKKDTSTLVEYTTAGKVVQTWSIKGKMDGLGADPMHHRVIATLNEDANSHLATVTPSAPAAAQVVNYNYSPDPRGTSTPAALKTGGGPIRWTWTAPATSSSRGRTRGRSPGPQRSRWF